MKHKHWLAAGGMAALGMSAWAQSSVEMFGIVDVHINSARSGATRLSRLEDGGSAASRIGFRGSEDLGGGLKAIYTLESGFAPDQGTFNQGGRGFGRQSWVGLGGNWGSLTMGRQNSMLFWSLLDSDIIGPAVFAMGSLDAYIPNSRA
ncbi:porin, partial [Bacillus cereus]|nr:porin [Bacillus cereus]